MKCDEGIECGFSAIRDSLLALPFENATAEEVLGRFRENLSRLKEYMDKYDVIARDLGLDRTVEESKDRRTARLERQTRDYELLTSLQGDMLRKLCAVCVSEGSGRAYQLISQNESVNCSNPWVDWESCFRRPRRRELRLIRASSNTVFLSLRRI